MFGPDQVISGAISLATYFVEAQKKKSENSQAANDLIETCCILTDYLVKIKTAVEKRDFQLSKELPSFESCEKLLSKATQTLNRYYPDRKSLLKSRGFNNQFTELDRQISNMRVTLNQEYTLFCSTHPLLQAQPQIVPEPLPVLVPAPAPAPVSEPPTAHLVTRYLSAHHPKLAHERELSKLIAGKTEAEKLDVARKFLSNKELEDAIFLYTEIKTPKAHYNLGRIYRKGEGIDKADHNLAMHYYELAREQNEDVRVAAMATLDIGVIKKEHGEFEDAFNIFQSLAEADELKKDCSDIQKLAQQNLDNLKPNQKHMKNG